jgi:hypothetical protein
VGDRNVNERSIKGCDKVKRKVRPIMIRNGGWDGMTNGVVF